MRALLQRVRNAGVEVDGEPIAEIGHGILALVGVAADDTPTDAQLLARKTAKLRIFGQGDRPFDRSVSDVGGQVLVVSQFTLHGDVRRGNRPSWAAAAHPEVAEPVIDAYLHALSAEGVDVASGRFGANMQVALVNDGPVSLLLDTDELARPRHA